MKMNLSQPVERRQEIALIGALLFVGLVAARSWVLGPHLASLQASEQYQSAIDAYKDRSETANSALRAKRLWLDKLLSQRELLSDMVFAAAKAEQFRSDLQAFCAEASCTVGSIRHVAEEPLGSSAIVARTTALAVRGHIDNIIDLIERLKGRTQMVSIESLRMTVVRAQPGTVDCDMQITIYVNLDKESGPNEEAQPSQ